MVTDTRRRVGYAGLAGTGAVGVAIALLVASVGRPYVLPFGAVVLVGVAGLTGRRRLHTAALAVGAAVCFVAAGARLAQFGPELLAGLLVVLGTVFAARTVQFHRADRTTAA